MTQRSSGTPHGWDVLVSVLAVQVVFAFSAAAVLILDPGGFLEEPRDQMLAALLLLMPITVAVVLAVRFLRRHQAERTRTRDASQLMDSALSTGQEWAWAVDDQGRFTFSSPASTGLVGWDPSELIGQRYDLVIESSDLTRARTEFSGIKSHAWNGLTVRCWHRDGRALWMEVSGTVRPPAPGQQGGFVGTCRLLPPLTAQEATDSLSREQLQQMLDQNRLLTAFQPIHSLATGELLGVEALTRFVDEDGAGTEFWFKEAAMVGLLGELELAALETALTTAKRLPPSIHIALNISPSTCLDPRLPGILQRNGLPLKRIVLELTERLEVAEYDPLLSVLAPLRQAGLRVAVDDAGSGFASMRHVLHIRPDFIKLDRSLITGIDDDLGQRALGAAMVEFARQISAKIVAEGIETSEELAAVTGLGMAAGQGYLLGRPSIHPRDWASWNESSYPGHGTERT